MNTITQATEKRIKDMVRRGHKFGGVLQDMLDEMKKFNGYYGATIKQMKSWGVELDNETEIFASRCDEALMNGLAWIFSDFFSCTFCLDLSSAHIKDFNKLVKAVDEMENDGWGTYSRY